MGVLAGKELCCILAYPTAWWHEQMRPAHAQPYSDTNVHEFRLSTHAGSCMKTWHQADPQRRPPRRPMRGARPTGAAARRRPPLK